jgi:hypothetical protein
MRWLHRAIACIEADYQRSADTHLIDLACEMRQLSRQA